MIIILAPSATDGDVEELVTNLKERGYGVHLSKGVEKTVVGVIGAHDDVKPMIAEQLSSLAYVERVVPILKPFKVVSREFHPDKTIIKVRGVDIGAQKIVVIAGPCAVETEEQTLEVAKAVKASGASILRGGAFKPSTSPYSFHGLGEDALKILATAREATGMPIITEVMDTRDVEMVARYADILQVGTRNMTNYALLQEVGCIKMPVMLKRGMSSTIEEWLQAAEYIANRGNYEIMLCERGIRTFETYTRNTFDVSSIPAISGLSHLPVIADPSHGTGRFSLVGPVSRASVAAGADGLMIEVHPHPEKALKDGAQSLTPQNFDNMMKELGAVARAVGRYT
ncbi:MAG: 3-deoxy-7-phosphoheptulonate synthase [Chloroflexi bacterium]|nr:3-deoxy-7-phosphoheptulonate synthase [Chloroflexota bacterium]MCL5104052.1 3-deoxy-7-phosphoheptulonate synthase [Armatimonadota bacterium]